MRRFGFALVIMLLVVSLGGPSYAADVIRTGQQASGTFSWMVFAMEYFGIDKQFDLEIESITYATKEATELALMAGNVDVTVDDFVNVVLMRGRGTPVSAVYPYTLALGGLVVRSDSDIRDVADLRGKVIGAASLSDKSLLILRGLTSAKYGFDPQFDSETMAAAAPLMTELLSRGDMDAALPFWHFTARMIGTGEFREIISVHEMLDEMGLSSELPNLIVLARDNMDRDVLGRFLQALDEVVVRMKDDDAFWDALLEEGLYSLPDTSLMGDVRTRWEQSLPSRWDEEIVDGLVRLVEQMVEVAGAEVVGAESLDSDAYSLEFSF